MLYHKERLGIHIVFLVMILIGAAALRIYSLGSNSLWEDEYFSLECSSGWGRTDLRLQPAQTVPDLISLYNARPIGAIWSSMARDENHPPLYFILLRFWREMFGDSAVALRSLSVLGSMLGIVFLYFAGEAVIGPEVALWACAMMAVAWPQIHEAQEARAYSLVTASALLSLWALVRIQRFGVSWNRMMWLFAATLALPLLHYMGLASVAAMIVYAAIGLRGETRRDVLLCLGAAVVAFAIFWGPEMVGQRHEILTGTSWLIEKSKHPVLETMKDLAAVCARFLIEPRSGQLVALAGGVAALVLPPLMFRRMPQLLLLWLWLIFPITAAMLIDLSMERRSLSMVKYTLAAAPALYLLVGLLAVKAKGTGIFRHGSWVIPGLVVLSCVLCVPGVYSTDLPDWREFARFVSSNSSPAASIVVVGNDLQVDGFSALGLTYNLEGSTDRVVILKDRPNARFFSSLHGAKDVCLISGEDLSSVTLPTGAKLVNAEGFPFLGVVWKIKLPPPLVLTN